MQELIINKDNRKIKDESEVILFQEKVGIKFPDELVNFLMKYEGCYLEERQSYYIVDNENLFEVNSILYLKKESGASIEAILEGHKYYEIEGYIPFAIDSGGWDYCVSIRPETYGQIWLDRFEYDGDDPMQYVAPSLEEFIDGLQAPE